MTGRHGVVEVHDYRGVRQIQSVRWCSTFVGLTFPYLRGASLCFFVGATMSFLFESLAPSALASSARRIVCFYFLCPPCRGIQPPPVTWSTTLHWPAADTDCRSENDSPGAPEHVAPTAPQLPVTGRARSENVCPGVSERVAPADTQLPDTSRATDMRPLASPHGVTASLHRASARAPSCRSTPWRAILYSAMKMANVNTAIVGAMDGGTMSATVHYF